MTGLEGRDLNHSDTSASRQVPAIGRESNPPLAAWPRARGTPGRSQTGRHLTYGAASRPVVVRVRIERTSFRFSGERSYRLSYLTLDWVRRSAARAEPPLRRPRWGVAPLTPVELAGFEPAASRSQTGRAAKLRYSPNGGQRALPATYTLLALWAYATVCWGDAGHCTLANPLPGTGHRGS